MTLEELEEALEELFPRGFQIETDSSGQIIIYTGLMEDDEELVFIKEDDEDELDFDEYEMCDESIPDSSRCY